MSTEDQTKSANFKNNILKFPGTKNPQVEEQQKEFARLLMSIQMKMKKDDFNVLHTHPNCYLSSAYYVKAGKNCGKFEIENPNIAKRHSFPEIALRNELNLEVASIDVTEGDLLLFPSYLPHKVGKNESGEDRIVISFNVDIK